VPQPCAIRPRGEMNSEGTVQGSPVTPTPGKAGIRKVQAVAVAAFLKARPGRRGSALPVVGDGRRPFRPTVVLVGLSLGGLQRRLGVLGPGLGRPGATRSARSPRSGPAGRPARPRGPRRPPYAATPPHGRAAAGSPRPRPGPRCRVANTSRDPAGPGGARPGCGRRRPGQPAGHNPQSSMAHRSAHAGSVAGCAPHQPREPTTTAVRPTRPTPSAATPQRLPAPALSPRPRPTTTPRCLPRARPPLARLGLVALGSQCL